MIIITTKTKTMTTMMTTRRRRRRKRRTTTTMSTEFGAGNAITCLWPSVWGPQIRGLNSEGYHVRSWQYTHPSAASSLRASSLRASILRATKFGADPLTRP
eukprot:2825690-Karenia_brevis.AAC.1